VVVLWFEVAAGSVSKLEEAMMSSRDLKTNGQPSKN
jgi:hypothetical protein